MPVEAQAVGTYAKRTLVAHSRTKKKTHQGEVAPVPAHKVANQRTRTWRYQT